MSSLAYTLSVSVANLLESLGTQHVSAGELLNELLENHPEYGRGIAREVLPFPETSGDLVPVDEWIARVARLFDFRTSRELHGRLIVVGLAMMDESVRARLISTGLLQAVASEIHEGVATILTPEARKTWRIIETRWHDSGAISITPADPPSKASERTQSRIPDPPPTSAPSASAAEETQQPGTPDASSPMSYGDLAEMMEMAGVEHTHSLNVDVQAEIPAGSHGDNGHEESASTSASEGVHVLPGGSAAGTAGAVLKHLQNNIQGKETPPAVSGPARGEPTTASAAPPTGEETVPAHPDDPAVLDTLARRPFARCIAARMDEVWKGRGARPTRRGAADTGSGGAFMLHLHGPWGSGKSSILNFLRDELQGEERAPEDRWVVVEFNAWRHQRIRPPWWALIRDVYAQSARQLPFFRGAWLRVRWWAWRVRADWLPVAAAGVIITVAALVILGVIDLFPTPPETGSGTAASRQADEATWKGVDLALKVLTGLLAAWGVISTAGRSLAFGSARAAQTYTDLKSDPLGPIVRLFQRLTARIGSPVAVFIDDLDRCDGKYVVELLEGIQTLFRTAPVTYVVAADRKWICASFEHGYKDFGDDIGETGRPLGYLFLDKLFQVSASVPRPAPGVQRAYWGALLRAAGTADAREMEDVRRDAEKKAEREMGDLKTTEELTDFIQRAEDPVEQEGRRAAAAQRITSPEAQRETQMHLLQGFADLLEPNPRSMKRLVNAYGLHQATHFLEHRHVPPHALARWTIIELRWPLLADYLASRPESVASIHDGTAPGGVPAALEPLFRDRTVRAVMGAGDETALDESLLRQIVESVDAAPARVPSRARAGPASTEESAPAATSAPS